MYPVGCSKKKKRKREREDTHWLQDQAQYPCLKEGSRKHPPPPPNSGNRQTELVQTRGDSGDQRNSVFPSIPAGRRGLQWKLAPVFGAVESGPDWGRLKGKACTLFLWGFVGPSTGQSLDPSSLHCVQATAFSCPECSHRPPWISRCRLPTQICTLHSRPRATFQVDKLYPPIPCSVSFHSSRWPKHESHMPLHPCQAPSSSRTHFFFSVGPPQWPTRWHHTVSLPFVPKRLWPNPWHLLLHCPGLSFTGLLGGLLPPRP